MKCPVDATGKAATDPRTDLNSFHASLTDGDEKETPTYQWPLEERGSQGRYPQAHEGWAPGN